MAEFDRRQFLKLVIAVPVGFVGAKILRYADDGVNRTVEGVTGYSTGNAGYKEMLEQACQANGNPQDCAEAYQLSPNDKFNSTVLSPFIEEVIFRAAPSALVSAIEGSKSLVGDIATGTGSLGMTKSELLVGVASSVLFGAAHNLTNKGFDTTTIPASQTFGGMFFWILQRKLGFTANTLAHSWHNFLYLKKNPAV